VAVILPPDRPANPVTVATTESLNVKRTEVLEEALDHWLDESKRANRSAHRTRHPALSPPSDPSDPLGALPRSASIRHSTKRNNNI
jgi:hypothetical protein